MIRYLALLLIPLLVIGCGNNRRPELSKTGKESVYFIHAASLNQKDDALRLADSILSKTEDNVYVIKNSNAETSESYSVEIGDYNSSYTAGRRAYGLFTKGIIKDYSIVFNDANVHDDFPEIYFVGAGRSGLTSVYKYEIKTKNYSMFWSKPGEMIVDLSLSADRRSTFILTTTEFGKTSIFPHINNVRLYRINSSTQQVEQLRDLGSGIQIFTRWESPNTLRIVFNSFDKKKSTFVVQNSFDFNSNGKMISNERKIFDIVKEKYPIIPEAINTYSASDNNFRCAITNKSNQYIYTLFNNAGSSKDVFTSHQKLNQAQWTDDNRYFVLSTNDISRKNKTLGSRHPETSILIVISTKDSKAKFEWKGAGYKNFILQGDLLFFDNGFYDSAKIYVHNVSLNKLVDTIRVPGGCGIRNIPIIQY